MNQKNFQTTQEELSRSTDRLAPLKKVTPLSKYLALALFIVMPFLGGWIGYTYAPDKIVEKVVEVRSVEKRENPQEEKIVQNEGDSSFFNEDKFFMTYYNHDSLKTDLQVYNNTDIGLSFSYPTLLGDIEVKIEQGKCPAGYVIDSCQQQTFSFAGIGHPGGLENSLPFLSVETEGHHIYRPDRGMWWIDAVSDYNTSYLKKCKSNNNCIVITNDNGLEITRTLKSIGCYYGCDEFAKALTTHYEYGIHNPKSEFEHTILTPIRIVNEFWHGDTFTRIFEETIIKTLNFID